MPLSPNTISDLMKITAHFNFLLTVSDVEVKKIPTDQRDCSICREPFEKRVWKQKGDSVNSPVKLNCGHIFGIQCLAHLVFTSDFANKCPLCRAPVIPDTYEREISDRSWQVAAPLLQLLMILDRGLASCVKEQSLSFLQRGLERGNFAYLPGKHMGRCMVLYEEFINQFCDCSAPAGAGAGGRLEAAEGELRNLRHQLFVRGEFEAWNVRSEARLAEIYHVSEQNLESSQKALHRAQEALEKSTGMFFLYGMVATLALLGACGQLSGSLGALYELPSRVFLRLWFIACIFAVARSHPSRTTLAMLSLVILGIPFE